MTVRFKLAVLRSDLSVVSEFGFGVDDAAIVVTTTSLTVAKLPEASAQLNLVDFPIA